MYGDTNSSAMWTWHGKKLSTPGGSMSSTHLWKKIDPFLLVKDGLIWDWKVWLCESTPASWLSPHPCSVVWDPQTQVQHQTPHHLGWLLWVVKHPATTAPANTTRNIQTDTLQQTNKPKHTHTHTHTHTMKPARNFMSQEERWLLSWCLIWYGTGHMEHLNLCRV
jgi:hypothetical protein